MADATSHTLPSSVLGVMWSQNVVIPAIFTMQRDNFQMEYCNIFLFLFPKINKDGSS